MSWILAAGVSACVTAVPGALVWASARRSRRWAESLKPAHRPGEYGVIVGRVVSDGSIKAPVSGRDAALVLCYVMAGDYASPNTECWIAGEKPLMIDIKGQLAAVEWTDEALEGLSKAVFGTLTKRPITQLEDAPEVLRPLVSRVAPPGTIYDGRIHERSLAPGDTVCVIGTLEATAAGHSPVEPAPLRVVGTHDQPLLFSTPGLTEINPGEWDGRALFGIILILMWFGLVGMFIWLRRTGWVVTGDLR